MNGKTDIVLTQLFNNEQMYNWILSQYPWAVDYAYYYVYHIYAQRDSIIPAIELIEDEDKDTFSEEKAYRYYSQYEKSRMSFATVIPTCNRPESIDFLLLYAAPLHRRLGTDIIIYDSSDNDATEKIVKKYINEGYYNVYYEKYTGVYDGFSLDHKLISIYKQYANLYDYLWLCRDGLVPVVDEIIERFRYYKEKNIGCVILDTKSRIYNLEIEKTYSVKEDCNILYKEQFSRLQTLGMLVFSGKFALKLINEVPLNEKTYSLWQMAAPFHLFAKEPYTIVFLTRNVFAPNLMASPTHFWAKPRKQFEQWAKRWVEVVDSMPEEYAEEREKSYMVYTVDFHPFTVGQIVDMRIQGDLTPKLINEYKKYIKKVTRTPWSLFVLISVTPRWLAKFVRKTSFKHPERFQRMANRFTHA